MQLARRVQPRRTHPKNQDEQRLVPEQPAIPSELHDETKPETTMLGNSPLRDAIRLTRSKKGVVPVSSWSWLGAAFL